MNDSTAKYHRFDDSDNTRMLLSNIIPFKNPKFSIQSLIDLNRVKRDIFLIRLYKYYIGYGYYNVLLFSIVNLLTLTFFVMFATFIFCCVNLSELSNFTDPSVTYHFSDAINWQGLKHINWFLVICLIIFGIFFAWKVMSIIYDVIALYPIKKFYSQKLDIEDFELSTIKWSKVTEKLSILQLKENIFQGDGRDTTSDRNTSDRNTSDRNTSDRNTDIESGSIVILPFTSFDVANRLMRKENYMIAMFNKDLLNVHIPLPKLGKYQFMCKSLEWNINYCVTNFIFDDKSQQLKEKFLVHNNRDDLIKELRKRFCVLAIVNFLLLPFIFIYMTLYTIFKYGQHFYKKPNAISNRQWSTLAKWKFREFNELPHVFEERLRLASKCGDRYIKQFPSRTLDTLSRLATFVIGSFLVLFVFVAVLNGGAIENVKVGNKNIVWYIGILGSVLVILNVFIKDYRIYYPHEALKKVSEHIHYIPVSWEENAHCEEIKSKFSYLYEYQLYSIFKEIIGIILTPFILWLSLSESSEYIVDFAREFSQYHPRLGYVCEFALFNLDKNGDSAYNDKSNNVPNKDKCKDGKLEKSYINFVDNNPEYDGKAGENDGKAGENDGKIGGENDGELLQKSICPTPSLFLEEQDDSDEEYQDSHSSLIISSENPYRKLNLSVHNKKISSSMLDDML